MANEELLKRIVADSKIMVGKPVIRGTRLTVQLILSLLAGGMTVGAILREYDSLSKDDILACNLFAKESLENTDLADLNMSEGGNSC